MPAYIVSFDIDDLVRKNAFKEKLKLYKVYCPINKHCWAIISDQKAAEIRDFLKTSLLPTDRIFVIRSGTEAAWSNSYGPEYSDWLKKHL